MSTVDQGIRKGDEVRFREEKYLYNLRERLLARIRSARRLHDDVLAQELQKEYEALHSISPDDSFLVVVPRDSQDNIVIEVEGKGNITIYEGLVEVVES